MEQYKQEFIERSSYGYLHKIWKHRSYHLKRDYEEYINENGEEDYRIVYTGTVIVYDGLWSKHTGEHMWLHFTAEEFQQHLKDKDTERKNKWGH